MAEPPSEDIFAQIDWPRLREQKYALLNVIGGAEVTAKRKAHLDGVLNLIDALQDHAVDVLGVPAGDVFLCEDEDEEENR